MTVRKIVWIEKALALAIHDRQLAEHGGGSGVRDEALLESALARPQQRHAYGDPAPDLAELAAVLAFGMARNHPFVDGNERTAHVCYRVFLALNHWELVAADEDKYTAMLQLAEGTLDAAGFAQWLRSRIVEKPAGRVHEPNGLPALKAARRRREDHDCRCAQNPPTDKPVPGWRHRRKRLESSAKSWLLRKPTSFAAQLARNRQPVQPVAGCTPVRQVPIEQGHERSVVPWNAEMRDFVQQYIFQALDRLLGQIGIQPNALRIGVAAASARLHALDEYLMRSYPQCFLPFLDQRRRGHPQLPPIPGFHELFALLP